MRLAAVLLPLLFPLALASTASAQRAPATVAGPPPVAKTNVTSDFSDVWWPDAEPGWGIQFVQNKDVIFATLFVYGPAGNATFFVATLENPPGGGTGTWTGTLYATTGPYFGGPFNPASVVETPVGTMTFAPTGLGTGTLSYTVSGTSVSKTINRPPLRYEDNGGFWAFVHTWIPTGAGCNALDLFDDEVIPPTGVLQILTIDADTAVFSLQWKLAPVDVCGGTMQYSQVGRFGQYTGTLSCSDSGRSGTLTFYEVGNRVKGLNGRYTMNWAHGCQWSGRFAGVSSEP